MMSKHLKLLLASKLDSDDEKALLEMLAQTDPSEVLAISQKLLNERRHHMSAVAVAKKRQAKAEEVVEKLLAPPLHPAIVLRVASSGRVDVQCGSRRVLVKALPEVETEALRPGDEVLLDGDSAMLVARSDWQQCTGLIGHVKEVHDELLVVEGVGGEESVMPAAPDLAGELAPGDRVIYTRDFPTAIGRLPRRTQSTFQLERAPETRYADIGGLDSVVAEVRDYLDLELRHPDVRASYEIESMRGITLVGPPGVGKTMLAKAIANDISETDGDARFLYVPPGALRGIYYGQTEMRIRELFATARSAPGLVVMFFDELDSFGSRGSGAAQAQDIDGRVLGTFLAELDGLEDSANVFCIAATNRIDRCDAALVRGLRLGDRIFEIPRPGREATAQILDHYLPEKLADGATAAEIVDGATSYLHASVDGLGPVANAVFRNGERREIRAADLNSGALLSVAVQRAKRRAARREIDARALESGGTAGAGLTLEDLLATLEDAVAAEMLKIAAPHAARQVLDFPNADEIAHIELVAKRRLSRHHHLRVA